MVASIAVGLTWWTTLYSHTGSSWGADNALNHLKPLDCVIVFSPPIEDTAFSLFTDWSADKCI